MTMMLWLWTWAALAQAGAPVPRPAEAELTPVVDLIYGVEFDSAAAAARRLSEANPGHPAGPFYEALVSYESYIVDAKRSTETLAAFYAGINASADRAQAWISSDPAQGYYYLGASEGFEARVLVSQKRFLKAMSEGTRSYKHLRRALELDKDIEDAYLGLGMYHYFRDRVPAAAKPFAYLFFGEGSNRELGLVELRRASEKAAAARTEARSILGAIYCSDEEAQWEKAAGLLQDLMTRYPRNPLYRLRAAYAAERRGAWEEAAALADPEGAWLAGLEPRLRASARAAALYRYAEAELMAGHPEKAQAPMAELETMTLPEPVVDWVVLLRAVLFDALGNDLEADHLYRAVDKGDAAKLAKAWRKLRYPKGPKFVKPLTGIEYPD